MQSKTAELKVSFSARSQESKPNHFSQRLLVTLSYFSMNMMKVTWGY
jgi:hypothetical protein